MKCLKNIGRKICRIREELLTLHSQKRNGSMSEWLGTGLQNRLHQFESGWNLRKATPSMEIGGVVSLLAYTIVLFMVMVLPGKR